jgi:hypothetical protein
MADKKIGVFGLYATIHAADAAIDALAHAGFSASDISALMPENFGPSRMGTVKSTKLPEGTAAGASGGAVVGGVVGLLAGIGALAIPGVGPLIAAGPIVAALTGAGVGGTVGGIAGGLIGLGIPEYEAKRYEGRVTKGAVLLSVHCATADEVKRAKSVLEKTGAEDIASTGEASPDTAEVKNVRTA